MSPSLPQIMGRDLLGVKKVLPGDLPATRTYVIAAFLRDQQGAVDRWISALADRGVADSPLDPAFTGENIVLEFPVLGSKWFLFQRRFDATMAAHIKNPRVLARTWTFYTNVDHFCRIAGITTTSQVSALALDESGNVLSLVTGEVDDMKVSQLLKVTDE